MNERPPLWTLLDGAAAFSFSMLVSLTIQSNPIFAEVWVIRIVKDLTHQNDGLMASTMLLLFPSTALLYGSITMIFAAKEAVERRAHARDERMRKEGIVEGIEKGREEGREKERRRILAALEHHGIELPPDIANDLNGTPR